MCVYSIFTTIITETPRLLLADGNALRSYDISSTRDDRPSFLSETTNASRIDSIAVDLVGHQWTAYMLSYHSKAILQTDITSLQGSRRIARSLTKRQSSQSQKPQTISPPRVIVSRV